jgi:hypothetical protein
MANETANNDNLKDPYPSTDKANQVTPQASPTGVNPQTPSKSNPITHENPTTATNGDKNSPQARVRISKATEMVDVNLSPTAPNPSNRRSIPAALPTTRRSILQPASHGVSQSSNSSLSDNEVSDNEPHVKEIHNCSNKLFKEYSDNGMKMASYHVTDFAGLYPVWPIIEFLMVPTGETKEDRMNSFIKCVVALFGEILYVNDIAMIA